MTKRPTVVGYHTGKRLDPAEFPKGSGAQVSNSAMRTWAPAQVDETVTRRWDGRLVAVHSPYLINLVSKNSDTRRKSVELVINDCAVAGQMGAYGIVVHLGKGSDGGREQWREAMTEVMGQLKARLGDLTRLLLMENLQYGAGSQIENHVWVAREFDVRLCVDTAHAWEAGYDPVQYCSELRRVGVGRKKIGLVHANGSRHQRGAKRDTHASLVNGSSVLPPELVAEAVRVAEPYLAVCELSDGPESSAWLRKEIES